VTTTERPAHASGTFALGGDLPVHRLGFGAMRLTGPGIWGDPADHGEAIRVLRRAVELGVDLIDTADSYGPYVSEDLIREALHPYPDGLVIATKAGLVRTGPGGWHPVGRPEYLRQECEMSLRRLGLERIDLLQLHRPDPQVAFEDQVGTFADLQREGKIRLVGLSNVTVAQLESALRIVPIASVQNLYNLADRSSEGLVDACAAYGIGFIPWRPVADIASGAVSGRATGPVTDPVARSAAAVASVAERTGATPSQVALAWLLRSSPVMLPIPGTSTVAHLEENVAAALVALTDAEVEALTSSG
jgi:aryl-alcohol dehydrogenase-like predicted oxidoreductase